MSTTFPDKLLAKGPPWLMGRLLKVRLTVRTAPFPTAPRGVCGPPAQARLARGMRGAFAAPHG